MARNPKGYKFYLRKWLNKPGHHSTAFVFAAIEDSDNTYSDVAFKIADCDRQISLDFYAGNKRELTNALAKIDLLVDSLQQFREALIAHQADVAKANGE